jgi:hypothetical protein
MHIRVSVLQIQEYWKPLKNLQSQRQLALATVGKLVKDDIMFAGVFVLQIQEYWKPMKNLQRAEAVWTHWYEWSDAHCMHGPNCARRKEGIDCKWGGRHSEVQMISGAVLPLWKVRLPAWLLA